MKDLIDGFCVFVIAFARGFLIGLLIVWLLSSLANAEPVVLSFTDPVNCPPCKTLDASWRTAKPQVRRIVIDVRFADRKQLAGWRVSSWPHTFLVDMDGGKVTKVYRDYLGAMTPAELLDFCEVPK